jgi:hypothetical protein
MPHRIRAEILGLVLTLTCPSLLAFPCGIVGKASSVLTLADGRAVNSPARLNDCEGVKVLKGPVAVTVMDDAGRKTSRDFEAGSVITRSTLAKSEYTLVAVTLQTWRLLKGDNSSDLAVQRNDDIVLLLNPQLRISVIDREGPAPLSIAVYDDDAAGRLLVKWPAQATKAGVLVFNKLERDRSYRWVEEHQDATNRTHPFRVVSGAEADQVRIALRRVTAATAAQGQVSAALARAEWLAQAGYWQEAQRELVSVGVPHK